MLPRKVLHVMNGAGGGAALSTLALIERLRAEGVDSCAVCDDAGSAGERARLVEATRGEVLFTPLYWWNKKVRADLWKRPLLEARQLISTGAGRLSTLRVVLFARRRGAELVHTNTILVVEGGRAARALGLPHVWHLRELVGPGMPFRLRLEGRALGRYLGRHSSRVVANSQAAARPVEQWAPGLVEVVPNGIDLGRFRPRAGPRAGRPVVGMVASLSARTKKHRLFIEAAARLPDLEFRLYGDDPGDAYSAALHARAGANLRFAGFVDDPARIMEDIDILAHPADNESFGRTVIEAMAAGLPVVGARGGGVAESVVDGETGFLAAPDDAGALAAAIARLTDPDLRARLGAAGRRRAEERYSLDTCARGILRVYESAMASA